MCLTTAVRAYAKTLWLYKYTTPPVTCDRMHQDPPIKAKVRRKREVVTKAPGTGSFSQHHSAAFYDPRRVDLPVAHFSPTALSPVTSLLRAREFVLCSRMLRALGMCALAPITCGAWPVSHAPHKSIRQPNSAAPPASARPHSEFYAEFPE